MTLALSEPDLLRFCAQIFPQDEWHDRFVNEARFGLSRIIPHFATLQLERPIAIEVGGGTCILASYLASRGVSMTVVEPLGAEFSFFAELQDRVLAFSKQNNFDLRVIRCKGEQLDIAGRFDLAYTVNALEHMRDPLLVIDNMHRSLKPGGALLAHCPNYHVPLEVHFNVVLITRLKSLNKWLYRSAIARYPGVWDELNFITLSQVRRHLRRRGYDYAFNRSVLRDLVNRLLDDPIFAQRMPAVVRSIGLALRRARFISKLGWTPLRLQTPMEFTVSKGNVL